MDYTTIINVFLNVDLDDTPSAFFKTGSSVWFSFGHLLYMCPLNVIVSSIISLKQVKKRSDDNLDSWLWSGSSSISVKLTTHPNAGS